MSRASAAPQLSWDVMDPDQISDEIASELLRRAPWRSLVVIGDSHGHRLEHALRMTRPGFRATTLEAGDARVEEMPDVVLISVEGADVLGRDFNITDVTRRMDDLIGPLAESGADIVTVGPFDWARSGVLPAESRDLMAIRLDHLDAITRRASERFGGLHVDTHHHPRAADPGIFVADGIRCSAQGHEIAFAAITWSIAASGRWS